MTPEQIAEHVARNGFSHHRVLPDGREIAVYPRIFNTLLIVGPLCGWFYDDSW